MDDLISRQAAIDMVEDMTDQFGANHRVVTEGIISMLPPVTPKPKTGHWIADVDKWGDIVTTVNGYRCDKCNAFDPDKDNYCPNCGAKMTESEDKE